MQKYAIYMLDRCKLPAMRFSSTRHAACAAEARGCAFATSTTTTPDRSRPGPRITAKPWQVLAGVVKDVTPDASKGRQTSP